jgi:3-hydroxybutyryl-CoA dehydrogenase
VSTDAGKAASNASFVVEAINENLELKKEIFRKAGAIAPKAAILASNTSGLSITEIASATRNPTRVIGTNWWNPPQIIPLVEMAKGNQTSDDTVRKTSDILTGVGKKPILVLKPVQGFVGNRLQIALFREALSLLEKGVASADDIDAAVTHGLGFRYAVLGPFKVADYGGLDVFYHLSKELYNDLDQSAEPQDILVQLVKQGKLGVKSGEGFYSYEGRNINQELTERDTKLLGILNRVNPRPTLE